MTLPIIVIGTPFNVLDYAINEHAKNAYGLAAKEFHIHPETYRKLRKIVGLSTDDNGLKQMMSYKGVVIYIDAIDKIEPYMVGSADQIILL